MTDSPCASDMFSLLGNERRLLTIVFLSMFRPGETVSVRTIARVISSVESTTPVEQVDSQLYDSAYNVLTQTHLAQMDKQGLLEYNSNNKTVTIKRRLYNFASLIHYGRDIAE